MPAQNWLDQAAIAATTNVKQNLIHSARMGGTGPLHLPWPLAIEVHQDWLFCLPAPQVPSACDFLLLFLLHDLVVLKKIWTQITKWGKEATLVPTCLLPKTALKPAANPEPNKGSPHSDVAAGLGTGPSQLNNFLYKYEGLSWIPAPSSPKKAGSMPVVASLEVEARGCLGPTGQADYANCQVIHSVRDSVPKNK